MLHKISSQQLKERLRSSTEHAILDVRREGDYARGHLFFATNIPRSLLELRIERLLPQRHVPITLCAESDQAAREAAEVLAQFGYEQVAALSLGGWVRKGGRIYSGLNVPSKAFGEFVEKTANTPRITPQSLKALLDRRENVAIFDARPFAEYQAMSIPGAIDCPGGELVYRAIANLPSPDAMIVVNCAGRTRSIIGAQSLIDAGIANRIVALRDGTMGWHLAGYQLEHGQTRRASPPVQISVIRQPAMQLARDAGVRFIDTADIAAIRNAGRTVYVFDIRDPAEYAQGHRADAVLAPGGQLVQTLDTFVAVRNAVIVVIDRDGVRAPVIASWLRQMGYEDVFCVVDTSNESTTDGPSAPIADAIIARAPKHTADEAFSLVSTGRAIVADLANSKQYRREHIRNAFFCERMRLAQQLVLSTESRAVILTSSDGREAAIAAADFILADRRVSALEGGTSAWQRAGYPLESGKGNLADNPDDVLYRPYDLAENRERAMQEYLDWEKDLVGVLADEPGVAFRRVRSAVDL